MGNADRGTSRPHEFNRSGCAKAAPRRRSWDIASKKIFQSSKLHAVDIAYVRKNVVDIRDKVVTSSCPKCLGYRKCDVVAVHSKEWSDEGGSIWGGNVFRIVECRGCETAFFQSTEYCSEYSNTWYDERTGEVEGDDGDIETTWPITEKLPRPEWHKQLIRIDARLDEIVTEVRVAIDNNLNILAGTGIRTAFDYAAELIGVDANLSFRKKIQTLLGRRKISLEEHDALLALTDAGSAAAHRGWKPSFIELKGLAEILDAFLYRAFIVERTTRSLKKTIPSRR
ncbi:DUF4145 domain-containing protein [Billgrantia aerodenitrificans]|uniref:DUF4145 domain-containing protein n=1 Tax=Billgrantia aerodenitrificans TaxID=2733483 RepID=A0ABS9AW29_9GAMM|nr:DUF4145 domain-containing protein [Halomonas aerodenitrificans]MCE8025833.1 hypothetical protein [Halomonas aerodenitrificans]